MCGHNTWEENFVSSRLRSVLDTGENHDEATMKKRLHKAIPMGLMALMPELPTLDLWIRLVRTYSPRRLSYDTDIVRAFAGAAEVLSSTFSRGLIHGLPIFYFDIALLHIPQGRVSRRIGQPSWSWTGWKEDNSGYNDDHLDAWSLFSKLNDSTLFAKQANLSGRTVAALLSPVAAYQSYDTSEVDQLRPCHPAIFNEFYKFQVFRNDTGVPLPQGWTRHHLPAGDYFTYDKTADDEVDYSFPLPTTWTPEAEPPQSLILLCTAPHVVVDVDYSYRWFRVDAATLTQNGRIIGSLALQDPLQTLNSNGTTCELIALSGGRIIDDMQAHNEHTAYGYSKY